ncbi:ABC transporter permease subunit [Enterococcus sp. DIV1314a]|uniref:ABC transporter permease subunit n=1 Tax=Enterococcus sp. DIV1314a TaxID=2774660 RepID=UPI003F270E66
MRIELTKLYRSKYLFILPIFIISIIMFTYVPYSKFTKTNQNDLIIESKVLTNNLSDIVEDMKSKDFPEEFYQLIEQQKLLSIDRAEAIEQHDQTKQLLAEREMEKINLDLLQQGKISGYTFDELSLKIEELAFFIENPDVEYMDKFLFTKLSTSYFIPRLFEFIPITTLLLIISILLSFYLTMEYREKTINFLNVIPYKKRKVTFDKMGVALSWIVGSWAIVGLLISLITTIQFGFGTLKYPFFYLDTDRMIISITSGEYMMKLIVSLILLSFFLVSSIYLISLLTKSTIIAMAISAGLILPAMMPSVLKVIPPSLLRYLPYGYLNLPELIFSRSDIEGWNPSWIQGITYFIFLDIICLLLIALQQQAEKKNKIISNFG